MSMDENKAVVRAMYSAVDASQSMSPVAEYAAPGYVVHFPGAPPLDANGIAQLGNSFYEACPGMRHELESVIAEGDTVALMMRVIGTHTQPLMTPAGPIPPQGRSFDVGAMNFFRFENGKIAEHFSAFDMMGFMQQIGAIPA